ncbi:hypothetical protein NESM_000523700 [Novymonas esmeraldas]|uniref:Uncharacterized protein n=1 Tax=Novymonas esmeraldas TaxID=1808958 RepID=A0AAW0EP27_9TRYP
MRGVALGSTRLSRAVADDVSSLLTPELRRRWAELVAAPPATATAAASALLRDTIAALRAPSEDVAPSLTTSGDVAAEASPSPSPSPLLSLLGSRKSSQGVWHVLRRQRVAWQEALELLPLQLRGMNAVQRQYLSSRVSRTPSRVFGLAVAAWDVHDDAALVQQYRALKRTSYVVEYARLLSGALRERPALPGGLLPVPYSVMLHGYELGRCSPRDAAMALEVSKHVTLMGRHALTRGAEERLVLAHATLEGLRGDWAAALDVVRRSRAVRLSACRGVQRHLRTASSQQPTSHPVVSAPTTVSTAATTTPAASHAGWAAAIAAFLAREPVAQTYPDARRLLADLPPAVREGRGYVLLASAVLQRSARRMFAGTLTRRLHGFVSQADWTSALSLACAADCYDLAAPLLQFATQGSGGGSGVASAMDVPPELRTFNSTVAALLRGGAASTSTALSAATAAGLTPAEALAHAITSTSSATWRTLLLSCPHAASPARLRYLLLAACRQTGSATALEGDGDSPLAGDRVECCTFASRALSRLVCAAAERRNQQYFFRVLPAAARAHHFALSPLTGTPIIEQRHSGEDMTSAGVTVTAPGPGGMDAAARVRLRAWQHQTATSPEECAQLMADLCAYLAATHTVESGGLAPQSGPRLTENTFLSAVAALAAGGVVQLPATARFHWPLAVFKAARLLRVSIDATLVASAVRVIPSTAADRAGVALPLVFGAYTLLGDWQAGLQLCARLLRKRESGVVELEPGVRRGGGGGRDRPQTHKFTASAPTLLEAMAQVSYAMPPAEAVRHLHTLDALDTPASAVHDSRDTTSLALLILELLQRRDERELCEEVRRVSELERGRRGAQVRLGAVSRRRMLLGAAFSLLDGEAALRRVLHAAGLRVARSADLDAHGMQRLLRVLPSADAARVLTAEAEEGRCAQQHWLCSVMSRVDLSSDAVIGLARLRPSSPMLSAVRFFVVAAAAHDLVGCLRGLVRFADLVVECPCQEPVLLALLRLLRRFLSDEVLLTASVVTGEGGAAGPHPAGLALVFRLFNRLQEVPPLSVPLKAARRLLRGVSVGPDPTPVAVWTVAATLHFAASNALQVPVPAAFTSQLLSRVAAMDLPANWRAVLLLFHHLRRPTMQERVLLVRALRHCGGAATQILLRHSRFLRGCPEQVVVWADEASGSSKWQRSVALLEHAALDRDARDSPGDGACTTSSPLSPIVLSIVRGWNVDERRRCGELLRRQGFIAAERAAEGTVLDSARVHHVTDERVRAQTEAILHLLQQLPAAADATNN